MVRVTLIEMQRLPEEPKRKKGSQPASQPARGSERERVVIVDEGSIPVRDISMSRSIVMRTGRPSFCAATAHAAAIKTVRVSLPPKPPPMRLHYTHIHAPIEKNNITR